MSDDDYTCSCDTGPMGEHQAHCETNHPQHPCHPMSCRYAPDDEWSVAQYRELLGSIWLYVDWRWITTQLTTEQKELWADAVDATGEPSEDGWKAERWWRHGNEAMPADYCGDDGR